MNKRMKITIILIIIVITILILLYVYSTIDDGKTKEVCPGLMKLRKKLFPFQISDVSLLNDLKTEKYYRDVVDLSKNMATKPTAEQIFFLLKYKKFLEMDGVYSMCSPYDVDLVFKLMKDLEEVDGDLIETGVWKGGMSIWMKGIIKKCDLKKRTLWMFDTYEKFPEPIDGDDTDKIIHSITDLLYNKNEKSMCTVEQVRDNFKKFDLYDDDLKFVKGNILETIPVAEREIEKIAMLRIDSDYYSSVKLTLDYLYWKIVKGGYIIIDDYNNPVVGAKQAVDEFRYENDIEEEMKKIDGCIFWKIL